MWFAIAHIQPVPILRAASPTASSAPSSAGGMSGSSGTASTKQPSTVVKGSVFEMPAGLPPFLKKLVTVPKSDEYSEFTALKSVAHQVGVPFSHTGPDFALIGTNVPFGKPVPSYEFLWYVGQSYIPGTLNIDGSGAIVAKNSALKK